MAYISKYKIQILLILTCILIPYYIDSYKTIVSLMVASFVLIAGLKWNKGYTILLIAVDMCIPYIASHNSIHASSFSYLFHIIRICILLIFFKQFFIHKIKIKIFNDAIPLILSILILSVCYYFYSNDISDITIYAEEALYSFLFFYIAYNDKSDIKEIFICIDIFFFFVAAYTIQEFILHNSPYQYIYDGFDRENFYKYRAIGISGNPLILSTYTILYGAFLFVRKKLYSANVDIKLIICICIGVLTVSKTTYLVLFFELLSFAFFTKNKNILKKTFYIVAFFTILVCILNIFLSESIENMIIRYNMWNGGHRLGSFTAVFNLFKHYPLGVGNNFMDIIREHSFGTSLLYDKYFGNLDNYFLTEIAMHGFLSIFFYYYNFFFLFKSFQLRKLDKKIFHLILFLNVIRIILSFSYNIERYASFNFSFFLLNAIIFKYFLKLPQNKKVNTLKASK